MTHDATPLAPSPDRLALRVRQMLATGRTAAARPMLRVLHGLNAAPALLVELDARLALAEARVDDALSDLSHAIVMMPGEPGLHACRAEALMQAGRAEDALTDAAEAVVLAPAASDAKALLGILLIEVGRDEEAAACLADAVQSEPANPSFRLALAEALDRLGRHDSAAFVLQDGIRTLPGDLALRRAATLQRVRRRDFAGAIASGESARQAGIVDASLFGLIGHAHSSLGQHDLASQSYIEALKLAPDDAYVRHLVAASGAAPTGGRAPADYVRVVFDGYADRFEGHILSLGYRVPGLIRSVLQALPDPTGPVTDLGCGTGLLAVTCDDLAGPWTGIDLSSRMLEEARAKCLYDVLIDGDIADVLPTLPLAGLVVAGDTLCYFGDLAGIFQAIRAHLLPAGLAVVTLETLAGLLGSHEVRAHGRFAHTERYVREAAGKAGFAIVDILHEVLRRELDEPVLGMIVTLRSP